MGWEMRNEDTLVRLQGGTSAVGLLEWLLLQSAWCRVGLLLSGACFKFLSVW